MRRGESIRWDVRLSKPLADGGATICEKHDFALSNYQDESMAWEVCQALTQAKDDGERMERRIQELGEEANNLEECLDDAESEIVRLKIAHLRRMAKASAEIVGRWPSVLASIPPDHADMNSWRARWVRKHMALQSACLAKITELKGSQCSTKS